eukprot:85474_1
MSSKHMNLKKAPLFDCCIRVLLRILEIDVESVSMEIGSLTNFADWLISMCTPEVDGQKLAGRLELLSSLILYADPREVLTNDQQNAVEILLAFLSNDLHRVTEASVQCLVFLHAFPDTSIITRVSDHDAQSEFAEGILSIINEADGKYHPELLSKFLTIVEDIFNGGHSDMFYQNDIFVLIEVLIRHLNNSENESSQIVFGCLSALAAVISWVGYRDSKHRLDEIMESADSLLVDATRRKDKKLVKHLNVFFSQAMCLV